MITESRRGVLYPERLPEFHRVAPPRGLDFAVRWFWIPEWNLPAGVSSRQEILPFPACNLVVEPSGVTVVGPPTRRSERVLTGSGWAVGALLLPAAVPGVLASLADPAGAADRAGSVLGAAPDPARLRDAVAPLAASELWETVSAAMTDSGRAGDGRRAAAVAAVCDWLLASVPEPDAEAALANALAVALQDPGVTRVDELGPRLHSSTRTLQRIAARYFGISLHAMIRRRRLQEGAERLREHPELGIGEVAAELGYSDHAHFTTDFASVLGVTPSQFRAGAHLN
ncbi:AraC family transcriptional regulator [Leucobacter luti]|uniref:helix-turn-helix domain-containing protein n=1 Tax=Leucobacter luti TaxID=340320 RepID=UPI0010D0F9BC|nr:helix-turn-helix domain-containing protein [Leucobacter luti]MCW2289624.1 AraC-like DNA-binding protein [Leucobacter luti]TCK37796.1 AraC family transcriptional regulator [Leucobacter luti]